MMNMVPARAVATALYVCLMLSVANGNQVAAPPLELFIQAASNDDRVARTALDQIAREWRDGYVPMFIDLARLMRRAPRQVDAEPGGLPETADNGAAATGAPSRGDAFVTRVIPREAIVRNRLLRFLERQTGKRFDETLNGWREWMWTLPYNPHPQYAEFKGLVYSRIDPRMQRFFPPGVRSRIRLDEIDWGGVTVNGIPPLVYPKTLPAAEARYLRDGNIVFGIVVNGEPRAYPKRILAWHEMATDRVGGMELTVVYCTLCGTVIPYESTVAGRVLRFGTSGLLYRSNKLMFDETSLSLWNSTEGEPVVGPLVGAGVALTAREVVTTTWGEWRAMHPRTSVLSLDTGHRRDYGEGVAYRDYFGSDDLYFRVPHADKRLRNKAEVLTMRLRARAGGPPVPVAIDAAFLERNRVFHFELAGRRMVVITSVAGANRVYEVGDRSVVLQAAVKDGSIGDAGGARWRVTEQALVNEANPPDAMPRVVAVRAFWFGWYAQFPNTQLIQ